MKIACYALIVTTWLVGANAFGQTVWTAGTGNWFTPSNWSAGVPNSSTGVRINNGGTGQIASSGASAGDIYLGFGSTDSGTISVSGSGNLDATSGLLFIGESGTGTFNITNGGTVSGDRFILGDNSGSTGIATVSGSGSTWTNNATCDIGFNGNATLNITNGGTVSAPASTIGENGSTGTVLVDGAGSIWNTGNLDAVGGSATGKLMITNGGLVSSGTAVVGRNPGSQGTVIVDGTGSKWTTSVIGVADNGGAGTVNITNGGTVSSSSGFIGGNGRGGMGSVTVDGTGSSWTVNGALTVGGGTGGGTGTLRIQNNATVSATSTTVSALSTLEVGANPNLSGTLTFNGGTLRAVADSSFGNSVSLGTGGVTVDSSGFNLTLRGTFSGSTGITKAGSGTAALSGSNTYSGGTTVTAGTLLINNTSGSGTGTGAVHVNVGTLGGTGTISGAVTVGTGSSTGASISPAMSVGTLTIQSALTLNSDATYKFELNSTTAVADKIVANGVSISGAAFSFTDLGNAKLSLGTTFVAIGNTSALPIGGTFSNLPDNSTFSSNGNTFQVSYEGGLTKNELTLTVVPEPSTADLFSAGLLISSIARWARRFTRSAVS